MMITIIIMLSVIIILLGIIAVILYLNLLCTIETAAMRQAELGYDFCLDCQIDPCVCDDKK